MYKLVLSDLDETLLVNHHVPEINKEAIKKLQEKGVKFIPATGRPFNLIQDILEELGTKGKKEEYSICLNGGCVIENETGKKLYFKGFDYPIIKELYEELVKEDGCTFVVQDGCYYMFHTNDYETNRKATQKANFVLCEEKDFIPLLEGKQFDKIMFSSEDFDKVKEIGNRLIKKYGDSISVAYSSNRYMEINTAGVSKGNALHFLCDYLHIDSKDTIAIGDNFNDTSMLIEAGLGVCVNDGQEDVKQIADYVTHNGFASGAVKEVIETFILKEE